MCLSATCHSSSGKKLLASDKAVYSAVTTRRVIMCRYDDQSVVDSSDSGFLKLLKQSPDHDIHAWSTIWGTTSVG